MSFSQGQGSASEKQYISALALISSGDSSGALELLEDAIQANPQFIEPVLIINELVLSNTGSYGKSKWIYVNSLLEQPEINQDLRCIFLRGRWHEFWKRNDEAIDLYENILEKSPGFEPALQQIAFLRLTNEEWSKAEKPLTTLCKSNPNNIEFLSNLGVCLLRQNRVDEALIYFEQAKEECRLRSTDELASVLSNLGTAYHEQGMLSKAIDLYKEVLHHRPEHVNATLNLGVAQYQRKEYQLAESQYARAITLDPSNTAAKINLAGLYLLTGRHKEGREMYENRLDGHSKIMDGPKNIQIWHRGELPKNLLIVHEQGLGDSFQMIRYSKLMKDRLGIECHFSGPDKLCKIIYTSGLAKTVTSTGKKLPLCIDRWIPAMSIPDRLESIGLSTASCDFGSYLRSSNTAKEYWASRMGRNDGSTLRIALNWQGNPDHEFTISRGRSFRLNELTRLLDIPNLQFVSLQKGPGSEQACENPFASRWIQCQDEINDAWDFDAAAAILETCDFLISSDSGIAHLAGAVGCNVLLMLPWLPEWRWGEKGNKTELYPNHLLFRQNREKDWTDPAAAVIEYIYRAIEDRSSSSGIMPRLKE